MKQKLTFFAGDKLVDSRDREFYDGTTADQVAWPARCLHAAVMYMSETFGLYQTDENYVPEFEAATPDEWNKKQHEAYYG